SKGLGPSQAESRKALKLVAETASRRQFGARQTFVITRKTHLSIDLVDVSRRQELPERGWHRPCIFLAAVLSPRRNCVSGQRETRVGIRGGSSASRNDHPETGTGRRTGRGNHPQGEKQNPACVSGSRPAHEYQRHSKAGGRSQSQRRG